MKVGTGDVRERWAGGDTEPPTHSRLAWSQPHSHHLSVKCSGICILQWKLCYMQIILHHLITDKSLCF